MTPLARYYLFIMLENERAAATAHRIEIRSRRPSLLDRLRSLALALRGQPRAARSA